MTFGLRRNALCGKLQCSNIQTSSVFGVQPSIISTWIGGAKCYGVDFRLGSDVPDPGMVNEGTKCGDDKVRRGWGRWRVELTPSSSVVFRSASTLSVAAWTC